MRLGRAVLGLCLLGLGWPAEAAPTANLLVPNPVFSMADAWFAAGCDPAYEGHRPPNGEDSVVMSAPAGREITIVWHGTTAPAVDQEVLEIEAVVAPCTKAMSTTVWSAGSRVKWLRLPAGTRWLVVHNRGVVGLGFSIH